MCRDFITLSQNRTGSLSAASSDTHANGRSSRASAYERPRSHLEIGATLMSTTFPSQESQIDSLAGVFKPIADYALLADCNSAALVDRDGSVSWLCLPRYDSAAVFARILDPDGGHWSITPTESYRSQRQYASGTLVLETTFTTESGSVKLTDALAFPLGQRHHELGLAAPHLLM